MADPPRGSLVFVEDREDLRVGFDPEAGPVSIWNRTRGASARWGLKRARLAHVSDPDPGDLERLVAEAAGVVAAERSAAAVLQEAPADSRLAHPEAAAGEAISLALELRRAIPGVRVEATWSGFDQRVRIGRADGRVLADRRRGERWRIDARLERGGRRAAVALERALRPPRAGREEPRPDPARQAQALAERLELRLDAAEATPGATTAVLAPGLGGIVVHELIGHARVGDLPRGATWLEGRETVGPGDLDVLDDPRRGRAPWTIDDEGAPAAPSLLVQRGKLAGRLHDLLSATRHGARPTGHGRRHGYRDPVIPRMGCTFVAAGRADPREAVAATGDGVYVRRIESASVDLAGGRAAFRVSDADRIVAGRIAEPLLPFVLILRADEALSSVDLLARDLEFDPCIGSCLQSGQPLATSVGAPTMRIGVASLHT